jgi:hypothetical protein
MHLLLAASFSEPFYETNYALSRKGTLQTKIMPQLISKKPCRNSNITHRNEKQVKLENAVLMHLCPAG